MKQLLTNELTILRKTKLFYILASIIVVTSLLATMSGLFFDEGTKSFSKDNWEQEVNQEISVLQKENAALENKSELTFSETMEMEINKDNIERYTYHLKQNIIPPSHSSLFNNLNTASFLIVLVAILSVLVSSNMIPKEFEYGTIKNLISSPFSRTKILLSKYITIICFILFLMFLMYITVAVSSFIFFDIDRSQYLVFHSGDNYNHVTFWPYFLKVILFKFIYLLTINTLAFALSIYLKNSSLSIIITLAITFLSGPLVSFLSDKTQLVKFFLTENWDLTKYLPTGSNPIIDSMSVQFSFIVIICYMSIMIIPAFFYFHKKDI